MNRLLIRIANRNVMAAKGMINTKNGLLFLSIRKQTPVKALQRTASQMLKLNAIPVYLNLIGKICASKEGSIAD